MTSDPIPGRSPAAASLQIALTGATGYVGGRLAPRLLAAGHRVRCLVRDVRKLDGRPWRVRYLVERLPVMITPRWVRTPARSLTGGPTVSGEAGKPVAGRRVRCVAGPAGREPGA